MTFSFFNSLLNVLKSDLCLLTYCFGGTHLCFSFSQHAAQLTVLSSFSFYSSLPWSTFSLSDHPSLSLAGHPLPPTSEWEWSPSFCSCSFSLCLHVSCSHKHFLKDLPNLSSLQPVKCLLIVLTYIISLAPNIMYIKIHSILNIFHLS